MARKSALRSTLLRAAGIASLGFAQALASGALAQDAAAPIAAAPTYVLPEVDVVSPSPLPGATGEQRDQLPAMTTVVTDKEFANTRSPNVTDTLQQRVPGVVVIDLNGNPFSQDLYYRGFTASPLQGTPQGLAVYQNGMRVNEAFGDTVNWDLIPPQAIARVDLFTGNPIFGLNALGGAVSIEMKNGFNWQGFEAQVMGGSFGRAAAYFQYGKQIGDYAVYVTADTAHDGGWRWNSPSTVTRAYGDVGYRSQDSEVHFIASGSYSYLGVIGPTPYNLLSQSLSSVFTFPQSTLNEAGSLAMTGKFDVGAGWQIASNFYIRHFQQWHTDGNDSDIEECDDDNEGFLCLDDDNFPSVSNENAFVIHDKNGNPIPFTPNTVYGTIDRTKTNSTTTGLTLQASNRTKILDRDNFFTLGGSIDRGFFTFSSNSMLGRILPSLEVAPTGNFPGSGDIIQTAGMIGYVPTALSGTTTYYGIYALDTYNLTPELALSAGARANIAVLKTEDATGLNPDLNSSSNYNRINPVVGLTYKIAPWITAYGGYSEANRAPTPLELNCANPDKPCLLENSLVSDPPLQQVVSQTIEAGLRGATVDPWFSGRLAWKAGYFHTNNTNDIIALASTITGRGYYANVPGTLRQGVEAGFTYDAGPLSVYGSYSYTDATYRFTGELASPFNPYADENGNVLVTPGKHIVGIPSQLGKVGIDYQFTPQFRAGADVLIVGNQYLVGDFTNQNPMMPMYWTANLHASYQLTENFQIFGIVNNLFNNRNASYGSFFETDTNAQLANGVSFTDPRTLTPLAPLAFYGGVKVNF